MEKSMTSLKPEQILSKSINISRYIELKIIIFAVIGFLLSRSTLIGTVAPLGVAYFIATIRGKRYKIPVFLGCLIGIATSANILPNTIRYIICLFIALALSNKLKEITSEYKLSLLACFIMLPISIGQVIVSKMYMYDVLIYSLEIIILFIAVYIFSFGVNLLTNVNNRAFVRVEESIAISFIVIFSIMGIGEIEILGVSIRSVLSTVVILISAIIGGATMGSASGVIVGIALMINNISSVIYMGIYSFSGLIGGAFNKLNKYFCIIGYILSWITIYGYTSGISSNTSQIRDLLIASLITALIPNRVISRIEDIIKTNVGSSEVVYDYIKRNRDITNNKLVSMQKAYNELAVTFDKVREKDRVIDNRDLASVIDMIYNDQCVDCSMKRRCWDVKFNHTYTLMRELLEQLEESGEITVNDITEGFRKECLNPEAVVRVSNYYYKMFVLDYNWSLKFSESRRIIANQIKSISKSIESLSEELQSDIMLDLEKEKSIYDELQRYNIHVNKVTYISKGKDDFEILIEKKVCNSATMCEDRLIDVVSNFIGEKLSAQKIGCRSLGGKCKITLTKAQNYKAITEVAKMSRDGHVLCGDNYTYMDINDGKYMVAISDGMGKGEKAYEESSVTIDILEKMMDAEIDNEIVINTINNMLLLKSSDEEMFSTLDLGILDLRSGLLETIKMGACSTYIKRDKEEIDLISSSSLPVGILSDIKLDRKNVKVKNGDYIIMVSDGILDAGKNNNLGDNWLIYFLKQIKTTNPREIANLILDRALEIQDGKVEDDMTVLVTKICNDI